MSENYYGLLSKGFEDEMIKISPYNFNTKTEQAPFYKMESDPLLGSMDRFLAQRSVPDEEDIFSNEVLQRRAAPALSPKPKNFCIKIQGFGSHKQE